MSNQPKHPYHNQNPPIAQHLFVNSASRGPTGGPPTNIREYPFVDPRIPRPGQTLHPVVFTQNVVAPGQKAGHHQANITLAQSPMSYVDTHVSNIHPNQPHSMNQMQMQHAPALQRHPGANMYTPYTFPQHHQSIPISLMTYNHPQTQAQQAHDHGRFTRGAFYTTHPPQPQNPSINLPREAVASAVSNDPKHVQSMMQGSQIIYKETPPTFPQNTLVQSIYPGDNIVSYHNIAAGASNSTSSSRPSKVRSNAIPIVDPETMEIKKINEEEKEGYEVNKSNIGSIFAAQVAAAVNEPSNLKATAKPFEEPVQMKITTPTVTEEKPQPNCDPAVVADFKAQVQAQLGVTAETVLEKDSKSIPHTENIVDSENNVESCSEESLPAADCAPEPVIVDSKAQVAAEPILETVTTPRVSNDESSIEVVKDKVELNLVEKEPANVTEVDFAKPIEIKPVVAAELSGLENPIKDNQEESIQKYKSDKKSEPPQKLMENKNTQKRNRNKNNAKSTDPNRRGVEKEENESSNVVQDVPPVVEKVEIKLDLGCQSSNKDSETSEVNSNIKEEIICEKEKIVSDCNVEQKSIEKSNNGVDVTNQSSMGVVSESVEEKNKHNKEENLDIVINNDEVANLPSKIENESIVSDESVEKELVNENNINSDDKSMKAPSLKYVYTEGQWSPVNTTGKKVYGREFLMNLQNDPCSKVKPSNLPDLDVVLSNCTVNQNVIDFRKTYDHNTNHTFLLPGFVKSFNPKMPTPSKKGHSDKPKSNKPQVININLQSDVKLRETENAWKPKRAAPITSSAEEAKTEELYKKVRSVLNKLTPQKFDTLISQVQQLDIDTEERLQGVIDLVFKKAVDEPNFSKAYAFMCKELSNMKVASATDDSSANFRKLLINRCQMEFEKNTVDENARAEKLKAIEECTDPEKKKELKVNLDEEERIIRVRSVGNIRFIGELFKQQMLTCKIMEQCIRNLLHQVDEENLECLCKLLTTVGKVLESKKVDLSNYFKKMQALTKEKGKVSSRIRFMLLDVIDLRANKWVPRRDDANPKTMDQIKNEHETENLNQELNNSLLSTPRKDDRRNNDSKNRGNRGGSRGVAEDPGGWIQPMTKTRQVYTVESSKLKHKTPDMNELQLGSRSTYQWNQPKAPIVTTQNKFDPLSMSDRSEPEKQQRSGSSQYSSSRSMDSRSGGQRDFSRTDFKSSNYSDNRNLSRNSNHQSHSRSHSRARDQVMDRPEPQIIQVTKNTDKLPEPPEDLDIDRLRTLAANFMEEFVFEEDNDVRAVEVFKSRFPASSHNQFVIEFCMNDSITKNDKHLYKASKILSQILVKKAMSLENFKLGLKGSFEFWSDFIVDCPRLHEYVAKILVHSIINHTELLREFNSILQPKHDSHILFVAELMSEIRKLKDVEFTTDVWRKSELKWTDFSADQKKIEQTLQNLDLSFLL